MLENDRLETASTEVTSIWRGELIDISSILKVESASKYPRRIDVIISRWISFSKSM